MNGRVLLVVSLALALFCIPFIASMVAPMLLLDGFHDVLDPREGAKRESRAIRDRAVASLPDLAGWIHIDGTPIDQPVVQATGEEGISYYLSHTIQGEPYAYGSVVLDHLGRRTLHTIAYGHRTDIPGALFGPIADCYRSESFSALGSLWWCAPAEYRSSDGTAPPGRYRPLCALRAPADSAAIRQFPTTVDSVRKLASQLLRRASARSATWRSQMDATHLFTLVTCSTLNERSSERTIVVFTRED